MSKKIVKISGVSATLGSDPEFFITQNGRVIGSEKILPPKGYESPSGYGKVIRDGIQAEINTKSGYGCRESHITVLCTILNDLRIRHFVDLNQKAGKDLLLGIDLDRSIVDIDDEEWNSLSPDSKILGCQPSLNIYDDSLIVGAPDNLRMRSAGGHIHFDLRSLTTFDQHVQILIKVCDILLGIPSVLLDREPRMAERRRFYGRAGEYRTPPYGAEYRTLSNFWLREYRLAHLFQGLAKLAYTLISQEGYQRYYGKHKGFAYEPLISLLDVDQAAVRTAIDESDFKRAWDIWEGHLRKWFLDHCQLIDQSPTSSHIVPLFAPSETHKGNIQVFEHLCQEGFEKVFGKTSGLFSQMRWESWSSTFALTKGW